MDGLVLLAATVCLLVIFFFKSIFVGKRQPPGPQGLSCYIPFYGRQLYLELQRLGKTYGNIYSLRLGNTYVVVLNDFQSTKDAFAQDAFIGRPPELQPTFNKKTIETKAVIDLPWKEQRRFSLRMLKDLGLGKSKLEEHIQEEIIELLEHIKEHVGKPFKVRDRLASSMLNNIASLMFGKRLKYGNSIRKMLTKSVNGVESTAGVDAWQIFFPHIGSFFKYLVLGSATKIITVSQKFRTYVLKEIKKHKKTLNPNNIRDFIDGYLMEIDKRTDDPSFCQEVLQDLVGGFFAAGSGTVWKTVEWLILTAAAYQDSQKRIQAEIDDATGKTRLPIAPDLKDMPYTEAFIMELMRWRTTIPINLFRYTITDTELKGFFIPKHSFVLSNLWSIHHDQTYWGRDADDFRPERFLSEDGRTVKKQDQLIPFSIGKRSCPGEALARVEVFLYFSSILQKFNLRLPEGKAPDFDGVLGIGLLPKPQEIIWTTRI